MLSLFSVFQIDSKSSPYIPTFRVNVASTMMGFFRLKTTLAKKSPAAAAVETTILTTIYKSAGYQTHASDTATRVVLEKAAWFFLNHMLPATTDESELTPKVRMDMICARATLSCASGPSAA
jgi:hypothetical protein